MCFEAAAGDREKRLRKLADGSLAGGEFEKNVSTCGVDQRVKDIA
jgi:hypothetical protein